MVPYPPPTVARRARRDRQLAREAATLIGGEKPIHDGEGVLRRAPAPRQGPRRGLGPPRRGVGPVATLCAVGAIRASRGAVAAGWCSEVEAAWSARCTATTGTSCAPWLAVGPHGRSTWAAERSRGRRWPRTCCRSWCTAVGVRRRRRGAGRPARPAALLAARRLQGDLRCSRHRAARRSSRSGHCASATARELRRLGDEVLVTRRQSSSVRAFSLTLLIERQRVGTAPRGPRLVHRHRGHLPSLPALGWPPRRSPGPDGRRASLAWEDGTRGARSTRRTYSSADRRRGPTASGFAPRPRLRGARLSAFRKNSPGCRRARRGHDARADDHGAMPSLASSRELLMRGPRRQPSPN